MPPRKGTEPKPATPPPAEVGPTPDEVYTAALLAGSSADEAAEARDARAAELGGTTEAPQRTYAAGGTLTLDDVPDDPDDAYEWLMRVNDLVNAKHPGGGWMPPIERMAVEYEADLSTGVVRELGPVEQRESWDPPHCPTPQQCFQYGAGDGTASCVHGSSTRPGAGGR